jgi:hypothetical protein
MEGMPLYAIHPLFTIAFLLSLSTVTVWFITFGFFLHNTRKQTLVLEEIMDKNFLEVFLVVSTIVVALSGCIAFSERIHLETFSADRQGLRPPLPGLRPPNPFSLLYGIGILLCEPVWIIMILSKFLRTLRVCVQMEKT